MTYPIIETPRGKIVVTPEMKAELTWNSGFQPKWQKRYSTAQEYMDSEILRGCEIRIPLLTGMLKFSGELGTEVGSGTVKWIAPYAKAQYYMERPVGTKTGHLRGPQWFERWKEIYAEKTIRHARKLAGGKK